MQQISFPECRYQCTLHDKVLQAWTSIAAVPSLTSMQWSELRTRHCPAHCCSSACHCRSTLCPAGTRAPVPPSPPWTSPPSPLSPAPPRTSTTRKASPLSRLLAGWIHFQRSAAGGQPSVNPRASSSPVRALQRCVALCCCWWSSDELR